MAAVVLRELQEEDWSALENHLRNPQAVRYTEFEPFTGETARWLVQWALEKSSEKPRTAFVFGIGLPPSGELVGIATLTVRDTALREADIGFIVGQEHWGKGYATAAVRDLLALGFGRLSLHRIFGECDPANPGSVRVMEKVMMVREGHLREYRWQKGQWVDRLLYAILDHEWNGS